MHVLSDNLKDQTFNDISFKLSQLWNNVSLSKINTIGRGGYVSRFFQTKTAKKINIVSDTYFIYFGNDSTKYVYNKKLDQTAKYTYQLYNANELFIYYF